MDRLPIPRRVHAERVRKSLHVRRRPRYTRRARRSVRANDVHGERANYLDNQFSVESDNDSRRGGGDERRTNNNIRAFRRAGGGGEKRGTLLLVVPLPF